MLCVEANQSWKMIKLASIRTQNPFEVCKMVPWGFQMTPLFPLNCEYHPLSSHSPLLERVISEQGRIYAILSPFFFFHAIEQYFYSLTLSLSLSSHIHVLMKVRLAELLLTIAMNVRRGKEGGQCL